MEDQKKQSQLQIPWLSRWDEIKETQPDPDFLNMLEELENK